MSDAKETLTERQKGHLPDLMGLVWDEAVRGLVRGRFKVEAHHMAPNGFLHAASVIALADSACGYGCIVSRPEGAMNFTTIELKANLFGTAREIELGLETLRSGETRAGAARFAAGEGRGGAF